MKYTHLSLEEIAAECATMARDTHATFGALDAPQLNWRPDETRWSVAQCFEHLLTGGELMLQAADNALRPGASKTMWQRLPVLPALSARALINAVSPQAKRRLTAPTTARPAMSHIDAAIIARFIAFQDQVIAHARAVTPEQAARAIMISPFVSFIAYSVLDAYRVIAAHQRRHFEQAQRVTQTPGFPREPGMDQEARGFQVT